MALSQYAFDRAEDVSEALHNLDGLVACLERELATLDLGEAEGRIWPLVGAIRHYRLEAARAATAIARSGAQRAA